MDPLTAGSLIIGGIQTIGGLLGGNKKRPAWSIPGALYEQVATARTMASGSTRPGDQQAKDEIARTAAGQQAKVGRVAGSGSQVLASAEKIARAEQDAVVKNNAINADYTFNMKRNLQNVLGNLAAAQREKFIKDTWEPYQESRETAGALLGAGVQNIFGVLQNNQQNQLTRDYIAAISK